MSCSCRKGAIQPGCERHDPQERTAESRPWWWLLAAPLLPIVGLVRFLRGGSGPSS